MNHNAAVKLLSFFFLMLMYFGVPSHAQSKEKICEQPLILSSTIDWFPYIYKNSQGESTGTDVELLRLILNEMGCELVIHQFPERRSLLELKKGQFDIMLGASKNIERLVTYLFSNEYRLEVNKFIYRSKDEDIKGITSLQDIIELDKSIAINLLGWYGDELERAKKASDNFVYSDTANKRIKMLLHNRVDIVIDDEIALCKELTRSPNLGIEIHPLVLYQTPVYFMFNKKNISEKFIEQFNFVLDKIRLNGTLKRHYQNNIIKQCHGVQFQ